MRTCYTGRLYSVKPFAVKMNSVSAYLLHRATVLCETLRCEYNSVSGYLLHRNILLCDIIRRKINSVSANLLHGNIKLRENGCRETEFREWVHVTPGDCIL